MASGCRGRLRVPRPRLVSSRACLAVGLRPRSGRFLIRLARRFFCFSPPPGTRKKRERLRSSFRFRFSDQPKKTQARGSRRKRRTHIGTTCISSGVLGVHVTHLPLGETRPLWFWPCLGHEKPVKWHRLRSRTFNPPIPGPLPQQSGHFDAQWLATMIMLTPD